MKNFLAQKNVLNIFLIFLLVIVFLDHLYVIKIGNFLKNDLASLQETVQKQNDVICSQQKLLHDFLELSTSQLLSTQKADMPTVVTIIPEVSSYPFLRLYLFKLACT
jgi:hypothetical protein